MIHFRKITLREISLPLREPFRISSGVETTRRILLTELTDAEGITHIVNSYDKVPEEYR